MCVCVALEQAETFFNNNNNNFVCLRFRRHCPNVAISLVFTSRRHWWLVFPLSVLFDWCCNINSTGFNVIKLNSYGRAN